MRPQSSHRASGFNQIEAHTVPYSQSTLIHYVHPSDCNQSGYASGGFTMKMMDNVAGITSYRHCRTNTVTASVGKLYIHVSVSGKYHKN